MNGNKFELNRGTEQVLHNTISYELFNQQN
jgi:hypothetical protein